MAFYIVEESGNQYSKYMTTQGYNQDAHTYTTENMWFLVTRDGVFYVRMLQTLQGNVESQIQVIGYR